MKLINPNIRLNLIREIDMGEVADMTIKISDLLNISKGTALMKLLVFMNNNMPLSSMEQRIINKIVSEYCEKVFNAKSNITN